MDVFMDILLSMKKDLHINLPKGDIDYLDQLAREKGCSRNDLVCEAVTAYRVNRKKAEIEAAIRADIERNGAHSQVFEDLEEHAAEVLLRDTEW